MWTSVFGAPRALQLGDGCVLAPQRIDSVISMYVMVVHGEVEACRNGVLSLEYCPISGWTPRLWAGDRGSLWDRSLVCWVPWLPLASLGCWCKNQMSKISIRLRHCNPRSINTCSTLCWTSNRDHAFAHCRKCDIVTVLVTTKTFWLVQMWLFYIHNILYSTSY